MNPHLRRWLRRYFPAEMVGVLGSLCLAWVTSLCSSNEAFVALAGTWGENIAYFGTMLLRERRTAAAKPLGRSIHELVLEFGPAAVLDSVVCRPLLMYIGLLLSPSPPLGIIAGKLAADITFYVPAIAVYESIRRRAEPLKEEVFS